MGILPAISGNKGTFKKGGEKAKKVMNCLGNGSGLQALGKGKIKGPTAQASRPNQTKSKISLHRLLVKGSAKGA